MNKILYAFTPIPKYFYRCGILDPTKKNFDRRLAFIYWSFSKCYTVPTIQNEIPHDPFEFICCMKNACKESGLSEGEIEAQLEFFVKHGLLIKSANPTKNRFNKYKWNTEKFNDEKVIDIQIVQDLEKEENRDRFRGKSAKKPEPIEDQISHEKEENRNRLRVENPKKPEPNIKNRDQNRDQNRDRLRVENMKLPEPKPEPNSPFLRSDKKAIEISLLKSDNVAKPRARENTSPFLKGQITAFFNPPKYRLRNGELLSFRMQKSLDKYSPRERERLLPNVQFYEEWVDSGKPIKKSHEAFLQYCITEDLAKKNEYSMKNDLYAKFLKSDYQANGIEILHKVIQLKKSDSEEPISISKELPPQTFANILENYVTTYYPRVEYAK